MKRFLGTMILFVGTLGWWGFVYPELCLVPESCEEAEAEEPKEAEEIRIKSRLYEYVCQVREKRMTDYDE
ncbi:MAG: hypothetical protein J6J79_10300 [Lachnospiraceae bacterium]|nr:hypothetical protein [Lachnospiraceae bacterium]